MRIPEGVFDGLVEVYGNLDKKIWVYSNGRGSLHYLALDPDKDPPKNHPIRKTHEVAGWLDLSQPNEIQEKSEPVVDRSWAILLLKLLMGLVTGSLILFLGIVRLATGSRHRH